MEENWWWLVLELDAEGVDSQDVATGCRRSKFPSCGVPWCACGGVWMLAGLIGGWWCVMCVGKEEARESLELLQELPANVSVGLIKLMIF
jgi:hypothetical protein